MTKGKIVPVFASTLILLSLCAYWVFNQKVGTQSQNLSDTDINNSTVIISGILAAKDIPQLIVESDMILFGKVIEKSEPIKIRPVNGGDFSLFTDYYIESVKVLKNSALFENINKIPVRIQGGVTEDLIVIHEDEPQLIIGNEYLLFLFKPGMGAGYNTEGDYFYVSGATQGVYSIISIDGMHKLVPQLGEQAITEDELMLQVEKLSSIVGKTKLEAFQENTLKNLESGFISEDEYVRFLKEANIYATIVE